MSWTWPEDWNEDDLIKPSETVRPKYKFPYNIWVGFKRTVTRLAERLLPESLIDKIQDASNGALKNIGLFLGLNWVDDHIIDPAGRGKPSGHTAHPRDWIPHVHINHEPHTPDTPSHGGNGRGER